MFTEMDIAAEGNSASEPVFVRGRGYFFLL